MRPGLVQLFEMMSGEGEAPPSSADGRAVFPETDAQGDLFGEADKTAPRLYDFDEADAAIVAAMYSGLGHDLSILPAHARRLFELSVNAFDAIVRAWMSEFPVVAEIIRYGKKILAAADSAAAEATVATAGPFLAGGHELTQRQAADRAATDRGDADAQAVRAAAYKVWHEIHRLMGLLRFCPDNDGVYVACCEPDHFVLPALGPHFRERFGQTPWAIVDKKRRLCLCCASGGMPLLFRIVDNGADFPKAADNEWENLWRHYHKTVNNENRNNPDLQRRFMPERYWKYLTEK
jgi:hypothetical protein